MTSESLRFQFLKKEFERLGYAVHLIKAEIDIMEKKRIKKEHDKD